MKKAISVFLITLIILSSLTATMGVFLYSATSCSAVCFDSYDLVIVTSRQFSVLLQPFVDHKNTLGVNTIVKTIEDIDQEYSGRDQAEQIKYCIQDFLEKYQTRFVLFVGGTEVVPSRYTHIYFSGDFGYPTPTHWVFASDFYYADVYDANGSFSNWDTNNNSVFAEYAWDGNNDTLDFTPDVYVGRLPCNDVTEVNIVMQKIMTYEASQAWSHEWFTQLVCVGGDSLPGDAEGIDEGEYVQQQVIDLLHGFTPQRIWASNGMLLSSSVINEAINNGAGFVFFNGHGMNDLWATHPHNSSVWIPRGCYTLEDVNALNNGNQLPIVISDACYHCQYDVRDDCFGWSFVRHPHGGAIAFIGGSDTDLGYPGTAIIQKGIERLCVEISIEYTNNCSFLGSLIGNAIRQYTKGEMNEVDMITVLQNHLFGDPSLRISGRSQPPFTPDAPTGFSSGEIHVNYSYVSRSVDPDDDDLYYMWDWGDRTMLTWEGPYPSGQNITASHAWTVKGTYVIRVRAMDTTGSVSNWSAPLPITMPYKNNPIQHFFTWLFHRFPHVFPLLRYLM